MKFNLLHTLFSLPSHCLSKQLFIKKYIIFFTWSQCGTFRLYPSFWSTISYMF